MAQTMEQRQAKRLRDASGQPLTKCLEWVRKNEPFLRKRTSDLHTAGLPLNDAAREATLRLAREMGWSLPFLNDKES